MIHRIRSSLESQLADARAALRLAPVEIALGWAAAWSLSLALEQSWETEWLHIGVAVAIAFPLVFSFSLLGAAHAIRPRARWLGTAAALTAAILYAATMFNPDLQSEVWRAACLIAASVLLAFLVPIRAAPPSGSATRSWFWLFDVRLGIRIVTVAGFAGLLAAGLDLAAAAIGNLFDLDVPGPLYGHITGWVLLGVAPWALVAGIPEFLTAPGDDAERAGRHARRAGFYLALPLLIVYGLILYGYAFKIAITGEVPRNLVSPVVLGAAAMWILAAVTLEPVLWPPGAEPRAAPRHGAGRLMRWLPPLLLPLFALGIWAIWIRVSDLGWTEFRLIRVYALVAMACAAILGCIRLVRAAPPPLRSIPAFMAAALLLAGLGPLSAPSVARRSQTRVLESSLELAGFPPGEAPFALDSATVNQRVSREVEEDVYERIAGSASFLYTHFGASSLSAFFSGDAEDFRYYDVAEALGLVRMLSAEGTRYVDASLRPDAAVMVAAPATLFMVSLDASLPDTAALNARQAGSVVNVRSPDGRSWRGDLMPLFDSLFASSAVSGARRSVGRPMEGGLRLDARIATIPVTDAAGDSGRLIARNIFVEMNPTAQDSSRRILRLDGWLFIPPARR